MPRFFVSEDQIKKDHVTITGSDANHIQNVLRLKVGDAIDILNSTSKIYAAKIVKESKEEIKCEIVSVRSIKSEPAIKVTIAQSLPKGHKMDLIVQKCTELGVHKIIPFLSERTVIKLGKEKKRERALRWQRIAKSSAEQSGRGIIPHIEEIKTFEELLDYPKQYDLSLIPWEMEEKKTLKETLKGNKKIKSIAIAIGPEGGFSRDEIEKAKKTGFIPITLGRRILRTETAPLVILSMISYEFES